MSVLEWEPGHNWRTENKHWHLIPVNCVSVGVLSTVCLTLMNLLTSNFVRLTCITVRMESASDNCFWTSLTIYKVLTIILNVYDNCFEQTSIWQLFQV